MKYKENATPNISEALRQIKKPQAQEETESSAVAQRKSRVGSNNPFWGRKHSKEVRLKISKSRMGKNYGMVGKNHPQYGKKWTSEKKMKITGINNYAWKGSKVGYSGLHRWVRENKPIPTQCEKCKRKRLKLDAANISQEYKRDVSDWIYICRRCHMQSDGRLDRFKNKSVYVREGKEQQQEMFQ